MATTALAQAETSRKGSLLVSFSGRIAPHKLPREGAAPVTVAVAGKIKTADRSIPPQLRTITVAINRQGRLDSRGLPVCRLQQIQPASTAEAWRSCAGALVGTGSFQANVALPEQSPFPSNGRVLAFNGMLRGAPVIFAHIYGEEPLPTSFTLPFRLRRQPKGTYAVVLVAQMPRVAAQWGYVSGLSLKLHRRYRYRGESRSYMSAGCPAPAGFRGAVFTFARATFGFEGGKRISSTMIRRCKVRG